MTNIIGFPGLFDKTFTIHRVAFTLFGRDIMWYGIILACCFVLAALYCTRRAPQFGSSSDEFTDLLLWGLPAAVIGCRIYYVANSWDYYSAHPDEIIAIWKGGLGMYGGIIAAALVVLIYGRRHRSNIRGIADLLALGFAIGQFIGRWANFVNAEAYGSATSLPWGMTINGGAPVHPTFLYESLWTLAGFLVLHFYSKHRRFDGEIALLYAGWYGLARFWLEDLRTDSLMIGHTGISASKVVGGACVVVCWGLLIYFYLTKKYPRPYVKAAPAAAAEASASEQTPEQTPEQAPEQTPEQTEEQTREPEAPAEAPAKTDENDKKPS